MIKVGVTGGIGSGKSRVCALFAALGVPVYDSDGRAKELLNGNGEIRDAVVGLLGHRAYDNEVLDRTYVASKVFDDKMLLTEFNGIVHPAVALDFDAWCMSYANIPYIIMESAILFESGFDRFVDKIIAVSAPESVRIERVARRDGVSRESVLRRIANQLTDVAREDRADYVINNDGDIEQLAAAVKELNKKLIR